MFRQDRQNLVLFIIGRLGGGARLVWRPYTEQTELRLTEQVTYVKDFGEVGEVGEAGEVWSEPPGGARRVATCAHRVVSRGCEDPHVRQAKPCGGSSVSNYV